MLSPFLLGSGNLSTRCPSLLLEVALMMLTVTRYDSGCLVWLAANTILWPALLHLFCLTYAFMRVSNFHHIPNNSL